MCKKVFCCEQCRERHEGNKHTKRQANCPFCFFEKLPLKSIEDKILLRHIVVNHLPLHCCLCGDIFKTIKDLESFGTCKWSKSNDRHSLVSEKKSLGTPSLSSDGKESSDFNSNYGSLTSPPELTRNTSTPVVFGLKTSFDFKTPSVTSFSLKSSQIDSASSKNDPAHSNLHRTSAKCDSSGSNYMSLPSSISNEETPFRSLPPNRSKEELPLSNSKKLGIMKITDRNSANERHSDNHNIEDMNLTNVEGQLLPESQSLETCPEGRKSDSLKKVRFSDEFDDPPRCSDQYENHSKSMAIFNINETEEYFEANDTLPIVHQTLDESQMEIIEDNAKNMEKENRNPDEHNVRNIKTENRGTDEDDAKNIEETFNPDEDILKKIKKENHSPDKETEICTQTESHSFDEDKPKNMEKEYLSFDVNNEKNMKTGNLSVDDDKGKNMKKENSSPDKISETNQKQSPSQTSTSRVLMMVVVENNSAISTSEMIDTSLKNLERIASCSNLSANTVSSLSSSNSATTGDKNYYSVLSQNYHTPPSSESPGTSNKDLSNSSNSSSNDSVNSSGILSAMTNALKNVMKNLSEASKTLGKNSVSTRQESVSSSFTSSTLNSVSNFAASFLQRPGKRPRDAIDTPPHAVLRQELSVSQHESRSPLAKRHRGGYYKIKGREPIARMRNNRQLVSPRGVSSETQVFHQGSLLVGDTVLPLPDRAHQSTQTD